MERLKRMKDCLVSYTEEQLNHLEEVDAQELGEAIDMIKDLEEAMYYCSITKAMEQSERDIDREEGKLYYTEPWPRMEMPIRKKNPYDGRSTIRRRTYMESKELHHDKAVKLKELEDYVNDLGEDMVEMIQGASPEEKQMLEKKLTQLATKISQLNV